ncbi:unnamed protein product [Euphydryas editha]|uniref:Endonuclease-reverse transcriptase n=1 Tax=Euphydryas editha TaxID=104508 RepID=A0AAU9V7D6_EUPED|nr:unnamed protein product [Euphydryas editha]
MSWRKYWSYKEILKSKLSTKLKKKVMDSSLLPCLSRVKIRHKTKVIDALQHAQRLKWKWAGHITRFSEERWPKRVTKWIGPEGKRRRGRPKARWIDDILQLAGRDWMKTANDRKKWGQLEEANTRKGP